MKNIFIPIVNGQHVVLTAYTSLEKSRSACQRYADEMGFKGKLKWRKHKNGSWSSDSSNLRFSIAPRILNGVSDEGIK